MSASSALGQTEAAVQAPPSSRPAAPLVLDRVTVVDVEHGTLRPEQRVVIVQNRIRAVGPWDRVKLPQGAQVVDARGKYLIPGLWDMHSHYRTDHDVSAIDNRFFLANGITGIRDAGTPIALDTLRRWQHEILAGTRVGPPRQLLSGQALSGPQPDCQRSLTKVAFQQFQTCVIDSADAVWVVDSLKAAGVDMIKPREVSRELYFAIAAEARRLRLPFGGHAARVTALEASDSGAVIVDHIGTGCGLDCPEPPGDSISHLGQLYERCLYRPSASLERCQAVAEQFRRNGTWWTLAPAYGFWGGRCCFGVWSDSVYYEKDWLRKTLLDITTNDLRPGVPDVNFTLEILQRAGVPILAATDRGSGEGGFILHVELAAYVAIGLTPLNALQAATLNPAKMIRATDSLGTVAPGKLADLVLLDADPLANIANTATIRAVIANGHYYDRARLDQVLAEARAEMKKAETRAEVKKQEWLKENP